MLIQRAIASLRDPRPFFRWMAGEPRRLGAAYALMVLQAALSLSLSAVFLERSTDPQIQQFAQIVRDAGVSMNAVVVLAVVAAPILAPFGWGVSWLIIRIGAGTSERLWEVAAWCQLPSVVLIPISSYAAIAFPSYAAGVTVIVALWCAWFVHAGVSELARGNAMRAAVIYAALLIGYTALAVTCAGSAPTASPGTYMG